MNLTELLENISANNIELWVDEDKLYYEFPENSPPIDLLEKIKKAEPEIIKILSQNTNQAVNYPLSHGQKALWFLYQLAPGNTTYNALYAAKLAANLDIPALKQAAQALVARHPGLRTTFASINSEPVQIVHEFQQVDFTIQEAFDLSQDEIRNWLSEKSVDAFAQRLVEKRLVVRHRPLNLEQGPVLRFDLLINHVEANKLPKKEHILLITLHQIVGDLRSLEIIASELETLYHAIAQGKIAQLSPHNYQYQDYVKSSEEMLASSQGENLWTYWQQKLSGELPLLNLPTDRPRPQIQTYNGASRFFTIEEELGQKLTELANKERVSLDILLLTALQILLLRYTNQEDILIGYPTVNRNRTEWENIVGYFSNPVVLRGDLSGKPTFQELLERSHSCILEAIDHQDYPFSLLVEQLQPVRNLSFSPLYQVAFVWNQSQQRSDGLIVESLIPESKGAACDLTLNILEETGSLKGTWNYNTDLFDSNTIERMMGHFVTLLEAIVANPQQRIDQLPLLTEFEQQQLLVDWNQTAIDYPQDKCIHQLFEEQVEQTPDAVAVVFDNQQLTYRELNSHANRLAHYLQSLDVKPDTLVGICVERSLEMVVGLLGILKAGGAYVPLDPEYPSDRLSYMLDDTQVEILLTQQKLLDKLPATKAKLVFLDEIESYISQNNQENPASEVTASHLANVIYTSGSTGKPKGVMVEHRGLVNLAQAQIHAFGVNSASRVLQFASFSFDACISEILMALGSGARLYLGAKDALMPGAPLIERFKNDGITHVTLAPSALAVMAVEQLPTWPTIIVAGEACPLELMQQWSVDRNFFNAYGPTEASVCATIAKCQPEDEKVTIGRPIANTQIYILDSHLQPVPVGVPGELHIGGAGLARGYLNRAELTQEKFIPNPFSESRGTEVQGRRGEERLYKTGDLARYLPDGNIEYLGRIDNQVKIRGFRIELGEIEAILNQHQDVQTSCVIAREDTPGNTRTEPVLSVAEGRSRSKRLVAYIVPQPQTKPTVSELRSFLKERLPDYMVPSAYAILESFPLTPNGKIDRRALPQPEARTGIETDIVLPRTPIEEKLAQIWTQVLRIEAIGIHDNFFELGGDSILSIQIISRAKLAGIELTVKQLFANPTIAQLATVATPTKANSIQQGLVTGTSPLTPIQHWFFEQNLVQNHHFNQSFLLAVPSDLNLEILEQAWQQLIIHHDALRLRFTQTDSTWQQNHANPTDKITISRVDLSPVPESEIETFIESTANELQASLNLSENLVQIAFFWLGIDKKARLLIVIHHLVVDGVSWRILLEDVQTAYQKLSQGSTVELPAKTTSFKDWAQQLTEYAQSAVMKSELDYWLSVGCDRLNSIPVDYTQGANITASAKTFTVSLAEAATQALLQDVPKAYKTQINDILLTALALVLRRWTNQKSVLFNLEGHGREEIIDGVDLSRTVGWFTTIFPVVIDLENTNDLGEVIKSVKEQLRGIPNKGIGYGLLRYLSQEAEITTQLQALPQAQISFNYLGQFDQVVNTSSLLQPASESTGHIHGLQNNRAHLLDINSMITGERLQIEWTYSSNFHQDITIETLAQEFVQTLQQLIAHCLSPENGGYTPSDFPLAKLNQPGLDRLLASSTSNWQNIEDIYPLSGVQQGMLFESLYAPDSGVYFQQWICTVNGQLNVPAFEQAWQQVVARHSILRTAFVWEELTQPLQIVYRQVDVQLQTHDWQKLSAQQQQQQLEQLLQSQRQQGFQLSQAPLMRLCLIQLSADSYQFIFNHHHLLLDGWSMPLLLQDLLQLYRANTQGETLSLQPILGYRNYIAWLQQQDLTQAQEFWRQKLAGFSAPTPLVVDKPLSMQEQQRSAYSEQQIQFTTTATAELQTSARQHQLTVNNLVQAAWAILLCRYSQETDVVFGATVSARPPAIFGIESMVGIFINTLPVRVQVSEDTQVLALLKELQAQQIESEPFSYSSLAEIQGLSDVPRGKSLFESIVVFENYPIDEAVQQNKYSFSLDNIHAIEQTNYPLTLVVVPGEQLLVKINYDTSRFDDAVITRLLGHFQTLLEKIVAHPEEQIWQLPMLTQPEQRQLLIEWNDTAVDYPLDKCIHQLFEEQVERTPDAVAVVFDHQQLTYQELNTRANQLANYLQTLGVKPDVMVGICVERSLEMVVGLLGILKAGGAYVPLDPEYPIERLSFMLEDAAVPVLLTQKHLLERLPQHQAQVICLDTDWNSISQFSQNEGLAQSKVGIASLQPTNLAYVIYTSGSTGKPKGAMNTHGGICNRLLWMQQAYQLTTEDCILQKTPFSFDVSVWEFFWPLLTGARLVLAKPGGHKDSAYLVNLIQQQQVTTLHFVPSMLQAFVEEETVKNCTSLKRVICSGEALPWELQQRFFTLLECELHNLYGPTEAAIDVTYWQCEADTDLKIVPIGRPIANTQIYILDSQLQPVPIGVPGELHIGGIGLARGYLNRSELTQEKFIPNPLGVPGELHIGGIGLARGYLNRSELTQEKFIPNPFERCREQGAGSRGITHNGLNAPLPLTALLYKTGDLARYLPDGNIEYLGRIDNQVKIRGFRIELGEIEATLNQHQDVQTSCVIAREDTPGNTRTEPVLSVAEGRSRSKRLVAYIVPQPETKPTVSELRSFLKERLPDYMVPSAYAILESFPLTPNGKIDRRALPQPEARTGIETDIVLPRTPIEEKLAQIWTQVLRIEQIGIYDNFFELGGDSILSIQIISRAKIAGIELTVKQLFANPTIAQLATVATPSKATSTQQGLVTGTSPLTPIQHWFFEQNLPQRHHFNQSFLLAVPSDLNIEILEQAWQQIVLHHDALRLRFTQTDSTWQQNHTDHTNNIQIQRFDLSQIADSEVETAIESIANQIQASLNLSENLVKVAFFSLGIDKQARLLIVIHHLVIDGVSWRILLEDLQTAYQQLSEGQKVQLPAKTTSFKDWAQQLTQYANSEVLNSELDYWLSVRYESVESIPIDYTQGVNITASAKTLTVSLDETQTQALLQDVPKAYKTQINDILLTALALVLNRWTDADSVLFNLEGHGREEIIDGADLSRTVGWFTTIFPVIIELGNTDDLGTLIKSIKEQLRSIPNKGIGYGLLRYLSQDAEISAQLQAFPQAEISFNYLGQFDQLLDESSWLQPANESSGNTDSLKGQRPHLLDVNAMIYNEQLQIEWTYSSNIHQQETIEDVAQEFIEILQEIIAHCVSQENTKFTPTDFPLINFNQLEIDQILQNL
ncbi:non-ribosomal peptide synthetase [Nostoc sp. FACHB-110]|uniref:non-ribosomal peptide synthetase n=1 Tax=Nostoc sp. FACHB-110 TaxID=2692834 RepID=UPI0018EF4943|nr:non-ribosomal peptide synthetase [Nostoc sp. FACHB-110]